MITGEPRNGIAAFFDIDGTLLPRPSLEWRFARWLILRRATPIENGLRWVAHGVRLAPRGLEMMRHANKMYLRGVSAAGLNGESTMQMTVPHFFPAGVEKLVWHAAQHHAIFLVSGTLEPLAREVAVALTVRLAVRGIPARIGVCATQLEEAGGRWTGRLLGDAMFGEAKKRAIERLAGEARLDVARCFAYADAGSDRWMLEAVGQPAAVNPEQELHRLARKKDWPIFWWRERKESLPARAGRETAHRANRAKSTEQIWGNSG